MSEHLSPQQMDNWLIGERPVEVETHLRSCEICARETARLGDTLTLFGGAVRSWSQQQMSAGYVPAVARKAPFAWWRMGLTFATLLLLLATPLLRLHRVSPVPSAQDDVLLQKVQSELSQSVPTPMEPLAKLMPNDFTR